MARSDLTACGLTLTAAPISPNAGAVSNTSAFIPKVDSACAAASPASPPPTIAILQLDDIHPPGLDAGWLGPFRRHRNRRQLQRLIMRQRLQARHVGQFDQACAAGDQSFRA